MTSPDRDHILEILTATSAPAGWAEFLHGLPEPIIRPIVTMAVNARVHPLVALAAVGAGTSDPAVRRSISEHLARTGLEAPPTADARTLPPQLAKLEERQQQVRERMDAATDPAERDRLQREHGELSAELGAAWRQHTDEVVTAKARARLDPDWPPRPNREQRRRSR